MSERVRQLPRGLREDDNLSNGIYVGNRHADFNAQCAVDADAKENVVGSCNDPKPASIFINDNTGEVYVPTSAPNEWQKYKLEKYHPFWTRDNYGSGQVREGGVWAWTKYSFRGPKSLSAEEISAMVKTDNQHRDDLYSYVLHNKDYFQDSPDLLFDAAKYYAFDRESAYETSAANLLEEVIRSGKVGIERVRDFYKNDSNTRLSSARFGLAVSDYIQNSRGDIFELINMAQDIFLAPYGFGGNIEKDFIAIAQDPVRDPTDRVQAISYLAGRSLSREDKNAIRENLFSLLRDWRGEGEGRFEAGVFAFSYFSSRRSEILDLFYETARISDDPAERLWSWKFLFDGQVRREVPFEYRTEAYQALLKAAKGEEGVDDSLRLEALHGLNQMPSTLEEERLVQKLAIGFIKEDRIAPELRWSAITSFERLLGEEEKKPCYLSMISLLEDKGLDENEKGNLAGDLFYVSGEKRAHAAAMHYFVKSNGLDNFLARLEKNEKEHDLTLDEAIERGKTLLAGYGDSGNFDSERNRVQWTIKKFEARKAEKEFFLRPVVEAEPRPTPQPPKPRKMIVTFTQ